MENESIIQQVRRLQAEQKAAEAAKPQRITDCYRWSGDIGALSSVVQAMRFVGLTGDLQIKMVTSSGALRISDYSTRATCQPGEYFWLEGEVIRSGDHTDWAEAREKYNAAVASADAAQSTSPVQHVQQASSPEPLQEDADDNRGSAGGG